MGVSNISPSVESVSLQQMLDQIEAAIRDCHENLSQIMLSDEKEPQVGESGFARDVAGRCQRRLGELNARISEIASLTGRI